MNKFNKAFLMLFMLAFSTLIILAAMIFLPIPLMIIPIILGLVMYIIYFIYLVEIIKNKW